MLLKALFAGYPSRFPLLVNSLLFLVYLPLFKEHLSAKGPPNVPTSLKTRDTKLLLSAKKEKSAAGRTRGAL